MKKIMLFPGVIFIFVCTLALAQVMLVQPVASILKSLKNEGYVTVQSVELNKDEYHITALSTEGDLTQLRINAHSGQIIEIKKIDVHIPMVEVVDKVEGLGYSGISKIERTDGSFDIEAIGPDGKKVKLNVNATSGAVAKL